MRLIRHLITPEYPPQVGGVSDYVLQVADGFEKAGEEVHVWAPAAPGASGSVRLHRDLGHFTPADLRRVGEQLDEFPAPRRILVQWVPHGYGYRSMNLAFCFWLWSRARRRGDQVDIMVHEAFLSFEGTWRQYAAAAVHRLMTVILLRAVERVWVSIPRYENFCRPYALGRRIPFQWLPLPSNVPVVRDPQGIAAVRSQYTDKDGLLIGHFGTYGKAINSLMEEILVRMLDQNARANLILIGPGAAFRESLLDKYPRFLGRIHATGSMAATDTNLSRHISACDLMIQPYPDGVSSRRTSFMAGLNHGKAVVTTSGPATEAIWFGNDALAMTATGDAEAFIEAVRDLCADPSKRMAMARAARTLYEERFDIRHAVAALRNVSEDVACVS